MTRLLKPSLVLLAFLALAFAGLRVYGVYHNEEVDAFHQAKLANDEAKNQEDIAKEEGLQSKCSLAWAEYDIEKQKAEIVRLQQGEIAYLKAQKELIDDKPLCDDYGMSPSASVRLSMEILEHTSKAIELREYARARTDYAVNRKLQTKHLFHEIWILVSGQKD